MGKRKSNIGGLARYVFETNEVSQPSQSSSSTLGSSSLDHIPADKDGVFLPTVREPEALDTRPQKKQKVETGLLGLGLEKYDASGLVPFYTDASQVPEHLQKCELVCGFTAVANHTKARCYVVTQTSRNENDTFRYILRVACWTKKAGTVSRLKALQTRSQKDADAM